MAQLCPEVTKSTYIAVVNTLSLQYNQYSNQNIKQHAVFLHGGCLLYQHLARPRFFVEYSLLAWQLHADDKTQGNCLAHQCIPKRSNYSLKIVHGNGLMQMSTSKQRCVKADGDFEGTCQDNQITISSFFTVHSPGTNIVTQFQIIFFASW